MLCKGDMGDDAPSGDGAPAALLLPVGSGALDCAAIAAQVANALIMSLGLPRAHCKPPGDAPTPVSAADTHAETPSSAAGAVVPGSTSFSDVLAQRSGAVSVDAGNADGSALAKSVGPGVSPAADSA